MKAPCYKCPDRHANCHSECESYISYAAECEARREERMKEARLVAHRHFSIDSRIRSAGRRP